MNPRLGNQASHEWAANLAEMQRRWAELGGQTGAFRLRQEQALRTFFSKGGLSEVESKAGCEKYLQFVDDGHFKSGVAEFVRAHQGSDQDPNQILPPALEDVPGLVAQMPEEWVKMFSRWQQMSLRPRDQALLAASNPRGLAVQSLADAMLFPVPTAALLQAPDDKERVPPIGREIADKFQSHLRLQRDIRRLDDFWTTNADDLAAFLNPPVPDPPAGPGRAAGRAEEWFRKSSPAGKPDAVPQPTVQWREPELPYAPTDPKIARLLHEWRAQTEREAEMLRVADADLTRSVARIGEELALRLAGAAKHPAPKLDPEVVAQDALAKARVLRGSGAEAALRLARERHTAMSATLPEPPTKPVTA